MRFQLEVLIPYKLIPSSHAHASAYFKGALAAHEGKPLSANPYHHLRASGFYSAWDRGWQNLKDGHIALKEDD